MIVALAGWPVPFNPNPDLLGDEDEDDPDGSDGRFDETDSTLPPPTIDGLHDGVLRHLDPNSAVLVRIRLQGMADGDELPSYWRPTGTGHA